MVDPVHHCSFDGAGRELRFWRGLCPTSDNRSYVRFGLGFPREIRDNAVIWALPHNCTKPRPPVAVSDGAVPSPYAALLKFAGMFTEVNPFTKQSLVVVCIGNPTELLKQGYELDQTHKITVVLYNKLEIRAVHDHEELDDAKIDAIMTDVADKLGAKRK